jgi:hypothetical protein
MRALRSLAFMLFLLGTGVALVGHIFIALGLWGLKRLCERSWKAQGILVRALPG